MDVGISMFIYEILVGTILGTNTLLVVDDEYLLYKVIWPEIAKAYTSYIRNTMDHY